MTKKNDVKLQNGKEKENADKYLNNVLKLKID